MAKIDRMYTFGKMAVEFKVRGIKYKTHVRALHITYWFRVYENGKPITGWRHTHNGTGRNFARAIAENKVREYFAELAEGYDLDYMEKHYGRKK